MLVYSVHHHGQVDFKLVFQQFTYLYVCASSHFNQLLYCEYG